MTKRGLQEIKACTSAPKQGGALGIVSLESKHRPSGLTTPVTQVSAKASTEMDRLPRNATPNNEELTDLNRDVGPKLGTLSRAKNPFALQNSGIPTSAIQELHEDVCCVLYKPPSSTALGSLTRACVVSLLEAVFRTFVLVSGMSMH